VAEEKKAKKMKIEQVSFCDRLSSDCACVIHICKTLIVLRGLGRPPLCQDHSTDLCRSLLSSIDNTTRPCVYSTCNHHAGL
jgi:hypothetical protein